jgi:hypothetical protein
MSQDFVPKKSQGTSRGVRQKGRHFFLITMSKDFGPKKVQGTSQRVSQKGRRNFYLYSFG